MGRVAPRSQLKFKNKIRSYAALLNYLDSPACLKCGYDIRAQLWSDIDSCPECGQSCRAHDIACQISGQRWDHLPVLVDVAPGVPGAWRSSVVQFVLGVFAAAVCMMVADISLLWLLIASCLILFWCAAPAITAAKIFGGSRGLYIWALSIVYAVVAIIAGTVAIAWFIWGTAILFDLLVFDSGIDNPLLTGNGFVWPHVFAFGAVVVLIANYAWAKRWIVKPCRDTCYQLTLDRLTAFAEQGEPVDSAPAGEGGDAPER